MRPRLALPLAAIAAFFLFDSLFLGRAFLMRDTFFNYLPWRQFAAEAAIRGMLPLWNPYTGIGKPFLAEPPSAVFYPGHLLFLFFPSTWALRLSWLLHLVLAGASMFALARHWRLANWPALLCGVGFMLGSWTIATLEFQNIYATFAWAPLTLLLASALGRRAVRGLRASLEAPLVLGLLMAIEVSAGHPQILAYVLIPAAAFAVASAAVSGGAKAGLSAVVGMAASAMIAALIMEPQLLATMKFVLQSNRALRINPRLNAGSVPWAHFLSLLFPFRDGYPGYPDQFHGGTLAEYWTGACYSGFFPALLAVVSFSCLRPGISDGKGRFHRFLAGFWVLTALAGAVLASGGNSPAYPFLFRHLPGFDRFRWPAEFLMWITLSIPVLSGIGMEAALAGARPLRAAAPWLCAAVFALTAADLARVDRRLHPTASAAIYEPRRAEVERTGVLDVPGRLWSRYGVMQEFFYANPDASLYRWGRSVSVGDALLPLHAYHAWPGQMALYDYAAVYPMLFSAPPEAVDRVANALGICAEESGSFPKDVLWHGADRSPHILRRAPCLPRVFEVSRWSVDPNPASEFRRATSPGFNPRVEAVVSDGTPGDSREGAGHIVWARFSEDRMDVLSKSEASGVLVVDDAWFPGWEAYVNGRASPVLKADGLFRGVFLPAGTSRTRLLYRPRFFFVGVWTSVCILAAFLAVGARLAARAPEMISSTP